MATATTRHVQITIGLTNQVGGPAARVAQSLWRMARAARTVLFAFEKIGGAAKYFVKIHEQMEDLNLAFAGILKAKGLADSFTSSMRLSQTLVQEIRTQAALLPGSLNEYVEIAKQSYSQLAEAGFNTVQEQAKFIGQYGAVALTLQVPAAQAGRDLMHMLVGNVRTTTRTWSLLNAEIGKSIKGWDKMDSKQRTAAWKGLGTQGRRDSIQFALDQYTDMVKFASNNFNSIWGTFSTNVQNVALSLSDGYFQGLKSALQAINVTLASNTDFVADLLAATVKLTGALLVLRTVGHQVNARTGMGLMQFLRGRVVMKNPFAGFAAGTKMQEAWVRAALQGPNVKYGSGAQKIPLQLGAGGQHNAIQRYTPGVDWQFWHGARVNPLKSYGSEWLGKHQPYTPYADMQKTQVPVPLTFLDRLKAGLPGLTAAIGTFLNTAYAFIGAAVVLTGIRALLFDIGGVTTMIADTWFRISSHFFGLMDSLAPLMDGLGQILPTALNGLLWTILSIVRAVAFLGKYAANLVDSFRSGNFTMHSAAQVWEDVLRDEERAKADRDGLLLKRNATADATKARGGGNVVFNDAKFTITQQFAEGFDPDRIAVAFADDLSALANRRLQSSFSPVGGM